MAQPNIVPSLFGLTPELYQQNRLADLQAQQARAGTMAAGPGTMLNPSLAPLYAQATQQGQLLGEGARAVAGLLGVQDPELAKIREVQQMRQMFDVSNPAGLRDFAQALGQRGYSDLAIQASAKAADIDKDIAAATKSRRESIPAIEEQAARVRYNELVQQFGEVEGARKYREEQLTGKKAVAAASATPAGRTILAVEAKKAEDLQKNITSGYTVLERLNEQRAAIEQGMIGGSFADTRTAVGTFASTIGLADPSLINALANSKSFKANQNALAAAIAKQLGVNPTDKDFQASLDQFAKTSDDPKASLVFIKQMQEKFGQRQKINEDMFNSYIDNEGTFRNYKGPKMVQSFTGSDELQKLLAEQARRKNKTKE
jgi:hypothetical protein